MAFLFKGSTAVSDDKEPSLGLVDGLISASRKIPLEILVYKGNFAPLFPTRFWPFPSLSRDSILIA
jgi:hypothetical protein